MGIIVNASGWEAGVDYEAHDRMIRDTKGRRRRKALKALMSHRITGRFLFRMFAGRTAAQIAGALGIPPVKARRIKTKLDELRTADAALGNLIDAIRVETTED